VEEEGCVADRTDKADGMDENQLTPEETMAFQRLPREAEPSRILEERVVQALRSEGILGRAGSSGGRGAAGPVGNSRFRPWMAAASVAASVVLFASGVVMGQWMGSESTTQAFIQVREQDAAQLALRIQEAGSAYVSALAALSELGIRPHEADPADPDDSLAGGDLQQGWEVAFGALYGAANELARLSPDDPDLLRVYQILEERRMRDEGWGAGNRNMVWF
jgi:hypothetical protein